VVDTKARQGRRGGFAAVLTGGSFSLLLAEVVVSFPSWRSPAFPARLRGYGGSFSFLEVLSWVFAGLPSGSQFLGHLPGRARKTSSSPSATLRPQERQSSISSPCCCCC
jgi:hypothetical protein